MADARGLRVEASKRRSVRVRLLGGQPVVVLNPTEHGQRNELALRRRRLCQLWIRVRDPVNRLRWAGPIVILDESRHDFADVFNAKEDEVVQSVFPQRAVESLHVCVGLSRRVHPVQTVSNDVSG